jgi:hypothetical protein
LTYNIIVAIITANFFGRNLTTNSVFGLYFLCFVYLFLNCYYLLLIRLVATCPGNPITQMSIQNGTLWLTYRNGHITNYTHTHTHTHTHTQTHTHTRTQCVPILHAYCTLYENYIAHELRVAVEQACHGFLGASWCRASA